MANSGFQRTKVQLFLFGGEQGSKANRVLQRIEHEFGLSSL